MLRFFYYLTFRDKCWKQKTDLVSSVSTELTQSIMRGDSPDRAIKNISEKFNVAKNKAGRLVMTESAFFASEAQKDCFNELDVERFEIVATLDSHTSKICQDLDGQVFDMKDYQPGVTAPPFHPWCRTTTVPYFEDNFTERAARDAEGNTYYVPSNMTYKDWENSFVKGGSKDGLQKINIDRKKDEAHAAEIKQLKIDSAVDKAFIVYTGSSENIGSSSETKAGDKVKVLKAVTYDGKPFKLYYSKYDVLQINGDRVVIGIGKTVTAAINKANIQKV